MPTSLKIMHECFCAWKFENKVRQVLWRKSSWMVVTFCPGHWVSPLLLSCSWASKIPLYHFLFWSRTCFGRSFRAGGLVINPPSFLSPDKALTPQPSVEFRGAISFPPMLEGCLGPSFCLQVSDEEEACCHLNRLFLHRGGRISESGHSRNFFVFCFP